MDTCVDFESQLFAPFLSEEGQINPQVYGADRQCNAAASCLKQGIRAVQRHIQYPMAPRSYVAM